MVASLVANIAKGAAAVVATGASAAASTATTTAKVAAAVGTEVVGAGLEATSAGLDCLGALSAPQTITAMAASTSRLNAAVIETMSLANAAEAAFVMTVSYPAAAADTLTGGAVRKYITPLDPNAGRAPGGSSRGPNIYNPGAHQMPAAPTT